MAKRKKANKAARGAAAVTSEAEAILRRLNDDMHLREAVANVLDAVGISEDSEPESAAKKKKSHFGVGKIVAVTGLVAGGALAASKGLRTKVLDLLFGAEEEFEYTPPTPESTDGTDGTDGDAPSTPLSAV